MSEQSTDIKSKGKTCKTCSLLEPKGLSPRTGSPLGTPWPTLKAAIRNLYLGSGNQAQNFWVSFMLPGNVTNDGSGNVTTVAIQSPNVNHALFIQNINFSYQQIKELFETVFNGLSPSTFTLNFQHRTATGDETGISVPSSVSSPSYSLLTGAGATNNVGDLRIAAEQVDGPFNILGFTYSGSGQPQVAGDVGGDMRLDSQESWRAEGGSAGSINIPQTVAHEACHSLSIGHSDSKSSLMYPVILNPTQDFLTRFPGGLKTSLDDRFTVNQIYGGLPTFYGVNASGQLWRRTGLSGFNFAGDNWSLTSSSPALNRCAIGPDSSLWAITTTGQVLRRNGVSASNGDGTGWITVSSSPAMVEISVGVYGQVFTLDAAGNIYYRSGVVPGATGVVYQQIPGALVKISCGAKGDLWGVNQSGQVWQRGGVSGSNPAGTTWSQVQPTPAGLTEIAVGYAGSVWALSPTAIYFRTGITDSNRIGSAWQTLDGVGTKITSSPYGGVVLINSADQIFVRTGVAGESLTGSSWSQISGGLTRSVSGGWLF